MASILIAYGGLLAGLGFVVHQIAPVFGKVTFLVGLAGGGLCLFWGIAALAGLKRRVGATLSAIAVVFVLLTQAVHVWTNSGSAEAISTSVRLVVTGMFLMTMGVVFYLFHGERPREFYEKRAHNRVDPFSSGQDSQQPEARSKR